jgi:hypothetical protein
VFWLPLAIAATTPGADSMPQIEEEIRQAIREGFIKKFDDT